MSLLLFQAGLNERGCVKPCLRGLALELKARLRLLLCIFILFLSSVNMHSTHLDDIAMTAQGECLHEALVPDQINPSPWSGASTEHLQSARPGLSSRHDTLRSTMIR